MPSRDLIALLGRWEGYRVATVGRFEASAERPTPEVWIELIRERGSMICSGCGGSCEMVHDHGERWVRDLPILDAQTRLCVQRFRVACPACGPKLERLTWLQPYARVTNRLAESVARMCRETTVQFAAEHHGLGWDATKAIDKAYLGRTLGEPDLSNVTLLALDEFALKKGHPGAPGLWVCKGRSREEIRPFFEKLAAEGRQRIQAVAMDMNGAYEAEVKAQCPQAEIVYDLFHVVAKYGREVIDPGAPGDRGGGPACQPQRTRGDQGLTLAAAAQPREPQTARPREAARKDDLKALWDYQQLNPAMTFFRGWYARAIRSRIEPLKRFAQRLKEKLDGILAHCRFPLHTSLLEGINNKIKVIKRMAFGFRDDDYFFLKIRAAFPGIPG